VLISILLVNRVEAACVFGIGSSCEPSLAHGISKFEGRLITILQQPFMIESIVKTNGKAGEIFGRKIYEMQMMAVLTYKNEAIQCRVPPCPDLHNYSVRVDKAAKRATISGWIAFEQTQNGWE
jgi:hypothetical protein